MRAYEQVPKDVAYNQEVVRPAAHGAHLWHGEVTRPPGSPVELALQGLAATTGQLGGMVDQLTQRLSAGGILQDLALDESPELPLPAPVCAVVARLNDNTLQLDAMVRHLAALVKRLAV